MTGFRIFQGVTLALVALTGAAVVFTRDPKRQVFIAGIYGALQGILYFSLHSPDVALSEIAVGSIALPALVLATLAKLEKVK
ncbi:MAG TPA: hydrogenase subunit MbhD domain-containing protein [Verrucomicrobiae bacterium]|nr:hydrogenase subunit MbhD domain-containing protein [Verrucomicrobiae bacterium]